MKYQPLNEWAEENFTTPPTPATLRKLCKNGDIPAKPFGKKWFVIINDEKPVIDVKTKTREERINKILMDC